MAKAEWRKKKTATVELVNELGGTDRGDGRVDTVDGRTAMTVDGDGAWNGGVQDEVGRTDGTDGTDDEGLAKDGQGK